MPYGESVPPSGAPVVQVQIADRTPYQYNVKTGNISRPSPAMNEPIHEGPWSHTSYLDVGIFRDTLAPSLALHSGLAIVAYGAARATDRVEAKDWLWPGALVLNAWWSGVGRLVVTQDRSLGSALRSLAWPERLIMAGVTLWGGRLLVRGVRRGLQRPGGGDDPRYAQAKSQPGWWDKALLTTFLPEAALQAIVALPFTAPFRHHGGVLTGYHPIVQLVAVGMFGMGFGLETLADLQLDEHEKSGNEGVCNTGVWSLVRRPAALGSTLIHTSFPLLLYASDMLAPVELLGPLANYAFLRYIAGDDAAEVEAHASQAGAADPTKDRELAAYRAETNMIWPAAKEVQNQWTWIVVGCGGAAILVEQAFRQWHMH